MGAPADLERWFTYHPPRGDQPDRYEHVRQMGRAMATAVVERCPPGADRDLALVKIREAVMWANAAIACAAPEAAGEGPEGDYAATLTDFTLKRKAWRQATEDLRRRGRG